MQPYQHLTASARNGVVAITASRPREKLVILGASCQTSAKLSDGAVLNCLISPRARYEAVAVAIINEEKQGYPRIEEVLMLSVEFEKGKAKVDLHDPFIPAEPGVIYQLLRSAQGCALRVIQGDNVLHSKEWSIEFLKGITPTDIEKQWEIICVEIASCQDTPEQALRN